MSEHHPTKAQVQAVADVFHAIVRASGAGEDANNLDMTEGNISRWSAPVVKQHEAQCDEPPRCGTYACHGGWYAYWKTGIYSTMWLDLVRLSTQAGQHIEQLYYEPSGDEEEDDYSVVDFTDGAQMMAEDLGFESGGDLQLYYGMHPELWGNVYGVQMFQYDHAFKRMPHEHDVTLATIAAHWQGVADRTPE